MPSILHTILSGRARWITHLVGWTLVALMFFTLISGLRGPLEALTRTALNMVFMLAMFYGNAKILVNRFFETGRYGMMIAATLVLWIGMAALRARLETLFFGGGLLAARLPGEHQELRQFFIFVLSFFLLLLFSTLYQLLENRYVLELRHRELQVRHTEAQLNNLKAQINPHFLFNTLNNIYAAATLQHPNTAAMVLRLSDLLRYLTYDGQAARVPLEKEIAQIQAYFDLFQLKSEPALRIEQDIRNDFPERFIEPVLLLPLVENALKHGDLDDNPGGWVRVRLQNDTMGLFFQIENSYNPDDRQKDTAGGVGLENVRRRLELNYPDRHRFECRADSGIFTVELSIT